MPETIDSAGTPEIKELPALHTPTTGPGSKTPPDPNKLTGTTTPIGSPKTPTPMGMPGAPMGGGSPGMPGAKPGAPGIQQSPEEKLDIESLDSLRQDIKSIISQSENETLDIDTLLDTLIEEGWRPDRLQNLMDHIEAEDLEQLFRDVLTKEYKQKSEIESPSVVTLPMGTMTETSKSEKPVKKPDNDQTGMNPLTALQQFSKSNLLKRGNFMSKKILLQDGAVVLKEANDVSDIISGITTARRKVEAALKGYVDTKIRKAGMEALGPGFGPASPAEGIESIMGGDDKGGLAGAIEMLTNAVKDLLAAIKKGEDVKLDSDKDISGDQMGALEGEIGKGKDVLEEVKEKGPMAEKKEEEKEEDKEKKPFPPKKEEASEQEENVIKEAIENEEDTGKEAASDDKKKDQEAMDVAMGKKGPEKKKDEKKAGEEESSNSIIEKLKTRVAEMKEANLYPFKDLNKQQVDNTNAQTAKDQSKTIDKEVSGGKKPGAEDRGESISPSELHQQVPAQKGQEGKSVKKGQISIEAAERIKQQSIENEKSKARLSVELAARQQLKGLLDNPLKEAIVNNMIEAGASKEAAEAIAFNSMIDGYEASQKIIIKEAFETFMEKDINDFIKTAEYTEQFVPTREKTSTEAPANEGDTSSREKVASVQTPPLRGTQTSKDRKEDYRRYWEDVSIERRGY